MVSMVASSLAPAALLFGLAAGCGGTTPPPPAECGTAATRIHEIQGPGERSDRVGERLRVEAVVTGRFPGLEGFTLQEEPDDEDGDPATSEGLFVYEADTPLEVSVGDRVRLSGNVFEHRSASAQLTELTSPGDLVHCGRGPDIPARALILDPDAPILWEPYENMLVRIDGTVTGTHDWARYGTLGLAHDRIFQPTQVVDPGVDALARRAHDDRGRILLDDGQARQSPELDLDVRGGDQLRVPHGVVDHRYGAYRIHPVGDVVFTEREPRAEQPRRLAGDLRVATFNLRNWFHTLNEGPHICGPSQRMGCRGAKTAAERAKQRGQLGAVLRGLDADIIALQEVENGIPDALAALQAELGSDFTAIEPGTIGTDVIRVALLYRNTRLERAGDFAILDDSVDPSFDQRRNRPVLVQSFETREGARFTVAVNHWKSKGGSCNDDPDAGDGQGRCNRVRTRAAQALLRWLARDPTGSGDPDFLVVGDLNSYRLEDPVRTFTGAGYVDLPARFEGPAIYTSTFDGRFGVLDHALASPSLAAQARDATVWHINADTPARVHAEEGSVFGSSDHDPVLVSFELTTP